jgi:hypothetical protein
MNKNKNIFENACFLKQYLFDQAKRMAKEILIQVSFTIHRT